MNNQITYPDIEEIKNYKNGGSLGFLKNFYTEVWANYTSYHENDEKLYDIFKEDHNKAKFIIEARVGVLDSMYSTEVQSILKVIQQIEECEKNELNSDCVITMSGSIKEESRNEISFLTKYFHWYNEVNNKTPLPIYDKNVRVGLLHYLNFKNSEELREYFKLKKDNKKENIDFEYLSKNSVNNKIKYGSGDGEFVKEIDKFIKTLELRLEGKDKIILEPPFNKLPTSVSIYRLVDKFLWLMYKIKFYQDKKVKADEEKTEINGKKENKKTIKIDKRLEAVIKIFRVFCGIEDVIKG